MSKRLKVLTERFCKLIRVDSIRKLTIRRLWGLNKTLVVDHKRVENIIYTKKGKWSKAVKSFLCVVFFKLWYTVNPTIASTWYLSISFFLSHERYWSLAVLWPEQFYSKFHNFQSNRWILLKLWYKIEDIRAGNLLEEASS